MELNLTAIDDFDRFYGVIKACCRLSGVSGWRHHQIESGEHRPILDLNGEFTRMTIRSGKVIANRGSNVWYRGDVGLGFAVVPHATGIDLAVIGNDVEPNVFRAFRLAIAPRDFDFEQHVGIASLDTIAVFAFK